MATQYSPQIEPLHAFIFAGEKSGDFQGAAIVKELKFTFPNLILTGVGGPHLLAEGLQPIEDFNTFQVMGFKDVLCSLPKLFFAFRKIKHYILQKKPTFCLLIDSPDFSLRMHQALRKSGYQGILIQHVCPSIWAWKKERKKILEDNLNLLTTLFPFESSLFKGSALHVSFAGHPLAEKIARFTTIPHWKQNINLPQDRPIISIFPGSRLGEIQRNFPFQIALFKKFQNLHPQYFPVISLCRQELKSFIHSTLAHFDLTIERDVMILDETQNDHLMFHSTLAIATSGTMTLELGLFHIPSVVTYKIGFLDYVIAKYLFKIKLPFYCLVNIPFQEKLFPEHIHYRLDINQALQDLSSLHTERLSLVNKLNHLNQKVLHPHGFATSAASSIIAELSKQL